MIEVDALVRRYGDFTAVNGVSFSIEQGEVVGLLGHNGAGKTTIMKMLTGYLEPSAGTVRVGGKDVQQDRIGVQSLMGYLPENLPIYQELSVTEYLAYAARLRRLAPEEVVPRAIEATRLQDKALDPIQTLSRGFKQRVGVAQAILHRPKYLILDEPSNGLDPSQIQQMRDLIHELAKEATVILSTHIMQEVSAVCDRALILHSGELVVDEKLQALQQGTTIQLATAEHLSVDELLADAQLGPIVGLGEGKWQFEAQGDANQTCVRIAQAAVAKEIPVMALSPATRDLETIFNQVNAGALEQSVGGQDAA